MRSMLALTLLVLCCLLHAGEPAPAPVTKVPDKLVVLTFDDSVASQATYVAPLLKKYGFGATFFITEGFEFNKDKQNYMTWEQIKALHDEGFEIGNHTRNHTAVGGQQLAALKTDVEYIESQCVAKGIPKPVSFCYPGYQTSEVAVKLLRELGYKFARAGGAKTYDPAKDEPLKLPQVFDSKPDSTLEQFVAAVANAKDGKVAVITFHGVPDIRHPWVSTDPQKFEKYLQHLKDGNFKVVALKELAQYLPQK